MAISAEKKGEAKVVTVQDTVTKELLTIEAEEIFLAPGIRSNADSLHLEKANVETDAKGWITTNEFLETSRPDVFALGDINGKYIPPQGELRGGNPDP
jgi:dihydrolipoamide dehydrogenase